MRHLVTVAFLALTACASTKSSTSARPEPVKPAEAKSSLKLSAPLSEWTAFDTEGFSVRFPPSWKMSLREKKQVFGCNAEGHICFLQWGEAKFGAEELFGYLSGRASTIKVLPVTTLAGDDAVVWAGYDSDGDPWVHVIRLHQGVAFHFAYFGPANKVPDDFLMVPQTLVFKAEPAKPKDETSL